MNGKGDAPRPVNGARYRANFDAIDWSKDQVTDWRGPFGPLLLPRRKDCVIIHKSLETPHNHRGALTQDSVRVRRSSYNRAIDYRGGGHRPVD